MKLPKLLVRKISQLLSNEYHYKERKKEKKTTKNKKQPNNIQLAEKEIPDTKEEFKQE